MTTCNPRGPLLKSTKVGLIADPKVAPRQRKWGLQAPKELDHGGADLRRAFLLGPMSAARQHDRRPELGNHCRLLGNELGKDSGCKIPVARHVERRNGHLRSDKRSQQLPAAIDIAPPAQGTAEPTAGELRDININVGIRDPGRQGWRIGKAKAGAGHHPASERRARGGRPRSEDTRLNSSHVEISYAVFCLKKKKKYDKTPDSNKKKKNTTKTQKNK